MSKKITLKDSPKDKLRKSTGKSDLYHETLPENRMVLKTDDVGRLKKDTGDSYTYVKLRKR